MASPSDMSGSYDRPLSDFNIINIMLPTKYYPALKVTNGLLSTNYVLLIS